ncbi:MAG: ABC transporter permease [Christensenellaceae bacterium]|jgi:ribose transport system permease protein
MRNEKTGQNTLSRDKFTLFMKNYTIVPILIGLVLLLSIIADGFLNVDNLGNLLDQNAINGVLAVGMTFLIINGYYDLSVAMVMCLSANLSVGLQSYGMPVALLCGIAVGVLIGAINGVLVAKVKMNAFVVTLASMMGTRGFVYIFSGETSIMGTNEAFAEFGQAQFLGVSALAWIFIIALVVGEFILRRTRHGRNTYATGGNEEVARNAGINTEKTTFINFVICGAMAGLAGILQAAKLNSATPTLGYPDLQMTIITCVVLGGSKLAGGFGSMWHTLGGVMAIGIINNGMNVMGLQVYFRTLVLGLVLIGIIVLDKYLSENKRKVTS